MTTPDASWWPPFVEHLAAAEAKGDVEAAQRLVMAQWWRIVGELDRIDRRWLRAGPLRANASGRPAGTARLRERAQVRDQMRLVLDRIAQWPDAALGLLDHRDLKAWRPFLLGRLARLTDLRSAMIDRAFAIRRGRGEVIEAFIDIARAERSVAMLEVVEQLLQTAYPSERAALGRLVRSLGEMGALDRALGLATDALAAGDVRPLIELLDAGCLDRVPPAVIEAVIRHAAGAQCVAVVAELRRGGHDEAASVLAEHLIESADIIRCEFDRARQTAQVDVAAALDIADVIVHRMLDEGRLPPRLDHELAAFLRALPLNGDGVAARVLDLAGLIVARPLREEIAANVACLLVATGRRDRARMLLSSMVNETQRGRVQAALGEVPG